MRSLTSTLVLLAILGGLVGYIYYDNGTTPDGTPANEKVFSIAEDQIDELHIKSSGGETTRMQKVGENWQQVEPETIAADEAAVKAITANVTMAQVQRVIDEKPTDVAQYGLNPARIEVGFRLKDQKNFQRLLVGEKTPTGTELYAKLPDQPRVFLISSSIEGDLDKSPFNLRDKTVLKIESDQVDSLEISDARASLIFAREGSSWRLLKPFAARADFSAVQSLLSRVAAAQMQKIVAAAPPTLRPYGLDRPRLTAVIGTGSSRATLLFGEPEADGAPFAKDAARPMVFTIEQSLIADFSKPAGDFRRKDLLDMRPYTADHVELRRGKDTLTLERTTAADGKSTWKNGAGKVLDTAKVEEVLTNLVMARATSFETTVHPSLKTPVLTVFARFEEGKKTETLNFSRAGADAYANRPDEPGSAKVDQAALGDALKAADGLQ